MSFKTFLEKLVVFFDSPFWQGFGSVLGVFPPGSYEESRKQYEQRQKNKDR